MGEIFWLWLVGALGVVSLFGLVIFYYCGSLLKKLFIEDIEYIYPKNKVQKIFFIFLLIFVVFLFVILFIVSIDFSENKFKGFLIWLLSCVVWIILMTLLIRLLRKQFEFVNLLYTTGVNSKVIDVYFLFNLYTIFLTTSILIVTFVGPGIVKAIKPNIGSCYKVFSSFMFLQVFLLQIIFNYLWLAHPDEMINIYLIKRKGSRVNELFQKVKLLLSLICWNTYYMFVQFMLLVVIFNVEKFDIDIRLAGSILVKMIGDLTGSYFEIEKYISNDWWIILFELWTKVIYFLVIGVFIIDYLLNKKLSAIPQKKSSE
ncbi:hypothetical protein [Caldicellulosiruptor sp. DIB 104C]|uniref:hypothetical protein n=1 Tax=Caldicellulosiruptor sp. DIB 104C TaxID=3019889 RepID=UPI002306C977|nr:hypothetical protein [Caldicellulosiruptor sp. DIB 104C]